MKVLLAAILIDVVVLLALGFVLAPACRSIGAGRAASGPIPGVGHNRNHLAAYRGTSNSTRQDAIYVWRDPARDGTPISDVAAARELIDFCPIEGIKIIIYDNWGDGSDTIGSGRQDIGGANEELLMWFIRTAHENGLIVEALYTDNTRFDNVLAYNARHREDGASFDRIHMDFEGPWPGGGVEPTTADDIEYYADAKANAGGMSLVVSISHHWDKVIEYGGAVKEAYRHILDIADGVDVQTAQDSSSVIANITEDEVRYASSQAKDVYITIETRDVVTNLGSNEWNTYFEEGEQAMKKDLQDLRYEGASFTGFAYHFYKNSYDRGTEDWPSHTGDRGNRSKPKVTSGLEIALRAERRVYKPKEPIVLQLTVTNKGNETFKETFRSAQAYDFVAKREGREIWRWAYGRMFAMMLTEFVLEPEESVTYKGMWNQKGNNGKFVPPGKYNLIGILKTRPERCSFPVGIEVKD